MPDTKTRLLIVDDEVSIRLSMSLVLAEIGYGVRSAADGFSALLEIRQQVPDILLSDLNMPGMSGFELLSVVRRRYPTIQTIAMSGAFSGNEVPSGVAADAFYQKGSSIGALLQIIGTVPQIERRVPQPSSTMAPLWSRRNGHESSPDASVTMVCPECLRTFPRVLDGTGGLMRETFCIHCATSIHYVDVKPSDRTLSPSFRRRAGVAFPPQGTPSLSN
jgi:CheY-like chemotaxis protein